jgi:beta-phosphoglucomutase-like phosphatase (HAD superfamily)
MHSSNRCIVCVTDKEMLFRERATKIFPLAGLLSLLAEATSRGIAVRCVTNAPRPNAELMINCLGVARYFPSVTP